MAGPSGTGAEGARDDGPRERIVLDTDLAMGAPGSDIDDGFALALAVSEPSLRLELVTTVNGNTDVATATRLSRSLLGRLGREDIPVVQGAAGPLMPLPGRSPGGTSPRAVEGGAGPSHAAVQLVEHIMSRPGEVTVVAIGPLTNIALALALEPSIAQAAKAIVVMGGAFLRHTNVGSMPGEFNFWVDPHAAQIVLSSGAKVRLVGLDVTLQVRLSRGDAERLERTGGSFGRYAGRCTQEWITYGERTQPGAAADHGSCALHDPLAVAAVAHPSLLTWQAANVQVECSSAVTRGVAVADLLWAQEPPEANCEIATAVDSAAFTEIFLSRVASL